MSDLFGNHILGFPTRRLKCALSTGYLPLDSLSKNSVVRIIFDPPNLTLAVDHGCKTIEQSHNKYNMSYTMRKLEFCICKYKGAVQLCSYCTADQLLCFHSIDRLIHLLFLF